MKYRWKALLAVLLVCALLTAPLQMAAVAEKSAQTVTAAADDAAAHKHTFGAWRVTRKATKKKNGLQVRTCEVCKQQQTAQIARVKTVTLSATTLSYTGKALQTSVRVADKDGVLLKENKAYTVRWKNNKNVGTATAVISGAGKYKFTVERRCQIVPQNTVCKRFSPDAFDATVQWTPVTKQNDGYLIRCSTDKTFKKNVQQNKVRDAAATSLILHGLQPKTTYYLQIHTFKTVGKQTYSSAWSKTQKFTTSAAGPHAIAGQVPKSARVSASYFDDVVFVGDSISYCLEYYESVNNVLGKAKFLTAISQSATNALWAVSERSIHPRYQGKKMKIEKAVPLTGAKKVYIMLGINDLIAVGVDRGIENFKTLCKNILREAPYVTLYVQSITPRTSTAKGNLNTLNNTNIRLYNQKLAALCKKEGWYFVNAGETFYDGDCLRRSYCDDPDGIGVHPTFAGCKAWVEYLYTHAV